MSPRLLHRSNTSPRGASRGHTSALLRRSMGPLTVGAALALAGCAAQRPHEPTAQLTPFDQRFVDQPGDAEVNYERGWRAELTSDWERAEQYYRRALAMRPEAPLKSKVSHRLLVVLTRGHRYNEAYAACKQRLVDAPGDRPARFLLAAILAALDRPREAEIELGTLQRTSPDDAQVYLALGKLYRDDFHDRARADATFRRYLALAPQGPESESLRYELEQHAVEASVGARLGATTDGAAPSAALQQANAAAQPAAPAASPAPSELAAPSRSAPAASGPHELLPRPVQP